MLWYQLKGCQLWGALKRVQSAVCASMETGRAVFMSSASSVLPLLKCDCGFVYFLFNIEDMIRNLAALIVRVQVGLL